MTEDTPWQRRLEAAGLNQRKLSAIVGRREKTVSTAIRGRLKGGVPKYLKVIIIALELMDEDQRERLFELARAEPDDDTSEGKAKLADEGESELEALRSEIEELTRKLRDKGG